MLDKIFIQHKTCGYKFSRIASKTTPRVRCPKCFKQSRRKRTHSMFIAEMDDLVGSEYTVLGEYINTDTGVLITHNECGHRYKVRPTSFLNNGTRCPKCAGVLRLSHEEFEHKIENLDGRDEYVFNERYAGYDSKISVTHKTCNHTYSVTPNKFICGRRCPRCIFSRGEKRIADFLDMLDIEYISEKTFPDLTSNGVRMRYDFYTPGYNTLIEFDGEQHFNVKKWGNSTHSEAMEDFRNLQERDRIKDFYAHANGMNLIRIKYTDYDEIENILKSKLLRQSPTTIKREGQ